jgi:choline dehydrogenase-like flavoprotein
MPLKQTLISDENFPAGEPDVQRTSLSLDVLGRFFCNTYDEATVNDDFDVIVIGSGMYGAYCAAKVYSESVATGNRLRILVLEAGPFLIPQHGQNIPNLALWNPSPVERETFAADAHRTRNLVWGLGWLSNKPFADTAYCVGGKSLYWGGWCPRLTAADLDHWPESVRGYLESTYDDVEFETGVTPHDDYIFDPLPGPDDPPKAIGLNEALKLRLAASVQELRDQGVFLCAEPAGTTTGIVMGDPEPPPIAVHTESVTSGLFSPDKFSSLTLLTYARRDGATIHDGDDSNDRLYIVPNAHVSKLRVPRVHRDGALRDGYRVDTVELWADGARKTLRVKPGATVVLALGCIDSTRLALESFPPAPGPDGNELMGRNLMAHLRLDFQFKLSRSAFARWLAEATDGTSLQAHLHVASFHLQADGPAGRFHLQVYASGAARDNPEGMLYRMIPDSSVAARIAADQDDENITVIFRACGEMLGDHTAKVGATGTNWIDLAGVADRDHQFDHARAYVHYADQDDAPIWNHMTHSVIALARQMGADISDDIAPHRQGVGSSWHDSGTLFMGEPLTSVTDGRGHFHHIDNVACVDQALFPTVGSANPVLTGLCLSRLVAETVVDRHVPIAPVISGSEAGFTDLLTGPCVMKWKTNGPGLAYRIVDGILAMDGGNGLGLLYYDDGELFEDFELRLQWRAHPDEEGNPTANSGVFVRAPHPPENLEDGDFYANSAEIQIDDTGFDGTCFRNPLCRTGAVYGIAPARVRAGRLSPDGWNEFRITVVGRMISVLLNGTLCSEGELSPAHLRAGKLALQFHTGSVQFRSIRVRRLAAVEPR